jgi:predicted metal-dependent peptidase
MKRTKKKLIKYFHLWTFRLGLDNWERHLYLLSRKKDIKRTFKKEGHKNAIAYINSDWHYMYLSIYINMNYVKGLTNYKLQKLILHELFHAIVNEMRETNPKHEERVATYLTNAMIWSINDVLEKEKTNGKKKKSKTKELDKTSI